MKLMNRFAYLLMTIALCATLYFTLALKPSSFNAFLFLATWLNTPYVAMGVALFFVQKSELTSPYWGALAMLISVGGILFLLDVIYWHPDAQGAIAVMMTPILQGVVGAILAPVVLWLTPNARR